MSATTVRQHLENQLYQLGFFETECKDAINFCIPKVDAVLSSQEIAHSISWDDRTDGYPSIMIDSLFNMYFPPFIAEWLEGYKPQHFMLGFFKQQQCNT